MAIKTIVMTIKTLVKIIVMKEALQKLHRRFAGASQKVYRSFTEALQKLFLKATIHSTVFLCKLESYAGAVNILGYQYLRISISHDINILGYQYLRISVS
jgi:hypothetical protein